jgi:mannose-6-phosphate isomerase-like protein (cupin superfamily)
MEKVTIENVASTIDSADVKRPLTGALGATNVVVNYYELAPGDSFAFGYHTHENQEEVFILQLGAVTFETEEGDVTVEAGEAIRFGPGEYQQGRNTGEERVSAFVIGAPQETGESEIFRDCADCGERTSQTIEVSEDGDAKLVVCLECGTETARFS